MKLFVMCPVCNHPHYVVSHLELHWSKQGRFRCVFCKIDSPISDELKQHITAYNKPGGDKR